MKVVTWLSSTMDPTKGVAPGKCVFTGEHPGVFCVPFVEDGTPGRALNDFWHSPRYARDLQVILEVPVENLFFRLMGQEKPLPIYKDGRVAINLIINKCFDDDNAVVIKNFDPAWIVSIRKEENNG